MRRSLLLLVVVMLAWLTTPALAASRPDAGGSPPSIGTQPEAGRALADRDADRISDELDVRLGGLSADRRIDAIVLHDGSVSSSAARRAVGRFPIAQRFSILDGFAARLTPGQVRGLARVPGVERVQADIVARVSDSSSDPDYGAAAARTGLGVDGTGTTICVLDTGADPNHEQLDGRITAFRDLTSSATVAYDDHGHGTHVASIAAGDGTGNAGAAANVGVAPGAELVIGKVLTANGSGTTQQIVTGIEWCAERSGVDVITMSLGTSLGSDGRDALSLAADAAVDAGKVVTVAAGNAGDLPMSVGSPGAAATAITVGAGSDWSAPIGAANHDDGVSLAYFSSRGPTLDGRLKPDVIGPGTTITAAKAGTAHGYSTYSGTSMATPYAAGAAALALDAGMAPADVKQAMLQTAQDRGPAGGDPDWGAGLLDVHALVAAASGSTASTVFPDHAHIDGSVDAGGTWLHTFEVGSGATGVPIAATIVIDGTCLSLPGFGCLPFEWSPDLDARLRGPEGSVLAQSTCSVGAECGMGRQETLHAMPAQPGTYTIEVYPYGAAGGPFTVDLSVGSAAPTPTPTPSPSPTPAPSPVSIHVGDLDGSGEGLSAKRWRARLMVWVHDDLESPMAGVVVNARFGSKSAVTCTTNDAGRCSVTKRYSTSRASVTATVLDLGGSLPFEVEASHDPDGDSDGTVVTIQRP